MKKKVISAMMGVAMTASLLAGCGGSNTSTESTSTAPADDVASTEEKTDNTTSDAATTEEKAEEVAASEIPSDYKYYFSFDEENDGVHYASQDKAATPVVQATEDKVNYVDGVSGKALYVDGSKGAKLDINGVGDSYTVSFWVYPERSALYMPTVQFGPDMHGDATGGQKYVNFTWRNDSGDGLTYPSVWAYDQLLTDVPQNWPFWEPEEVNDQVGHWNLVTMTVDASEKNEDGTLNVAHLYLNGEELVKHDADKNVVPVTVVPGAMSASDNFDFLLGINYWDAIMKGAFDEVYVYDYALDASQVKGLYAAGDATAKYEAPEREVTVTADETAMESIGSTDLSMEFLGDFSSSVELNDGDSKVVTLRNWSDGINNYDNFVMLFNNTESEAHKSPIEADDYQEYAAVRADAWGWLDGDGDNTFESEGYTFNYSWGNWGTWLQQVMVQADVTLTVSRNGSDVTVDASILDYLGTANTESVTFTTGCAAGDPMYFQISGEKCYIDILSVKDNIVVEADKDAIDSIGKTDFTNGWWTDWAAPIEIADGKTTTITFKNYSDGVNNWDNYVMMFTNEETEAHKNPNAPTDDDASGTGSADHVEYAAIRADAFGWDADYDNGMKFETSWGDDWASWLNAMKAADVTLKITRDGSSMVVDATIVDREGNEFTNKTSWTTTCPAGDPLYLILTCEECYIDIMSVEVK